jgi:hypothetical protein
MSLELNWARTKVITTNGYKSQGYPNQLKIEDLNGAAANDS